MGEVYQATDTKLNRQVALKILPEAFAGPRSVETVGDDGLGTGASTDRTDGIGTSAILHFGLALGDERTASLEIGIKL